MTSWLGSVGVDAYEVQWMDDLGPFEFRNSSVVDTSFGRMDVEAIWAAGEHVDLAMLMEPACHSSGCILWRT